VIGVLVLAEYQHTAIGTVLEHTAGSFYAIEMRHGDIHDDDIRPDASGLADGVQTIGRHIHHLDILASVKQGPEAVPYDSMIVS
jgi:hypothetical protein